MKIQNLTVEEAFASVQSGLDGLSAGAAARRLGEFGSNEVEPVRRESRLPRFLRGFTHFFAIILWLAAALAFFAAAREPGQGMLASGFAIVGVIVINGVFSFAQEYRAERVLDALQRLLPQQVALRRDGATAPAPASASSLVPGDMLFLVSGDKVPADCRVIEAFALRVNNATITGEPMPQSREASAIHPITPASTTNAPHVEPKPQETPSPP